MRLRYEFMDDDSNRGAPATIGIVVRVIPLDDFRDADILRTSNWTIPSRSSVPRFVRLALLPIIFWALPGCLWPEHAETSNWMKQFRSQALSPDHALIEFAMIER